MHEFLVRLRDGLFSRLTLSVWLATSLMATLAGPFGTFAGMDPVTRTTFWSGVIALSIVVALVLKSAIRAFLPDMEDWPETLVFAPLLALVFTPLLELVVAAHTVGPPPMSIAEMGGFVLLVPFVVTAIRRVMSETPSPELYEPARRPKPRILQRLPDEWGQKILRISVRDHYVEIVTDRTQETVLMRFSDAISEAEGIPGLQVHRSHWVAENAVTAVQKENGRMFLTLEDGSRVPVSRGFRTAVEQAGIAGRAA